MAHEAVEHNQVLASDWGGGRSPFGVGWPKLMMWVFLVSDTLTFAGLLAGYGALRLSLGRWPAQAEIFDLYLVGAMTFILICSSATMAVAVSAARRGDRGRVIPFLLLTALGGLLFLTGQAYEWTKFIHEGARLSGNPWGVPQFSATFFIITGFHGGHVSVGVLYLLATALRWGLRRIQPESVEIAGLYWHFVDLVWVFIFTLLYLI
ncbi:MAG: cytochrome c oxidase subunit 3 [Armatimonadota bacterium]|nr:cytochrome c oxidase subunit 3 [Armatimonadota bacterium]MDR7402148.1 cytochrome c oxidase subunit 3 [Armatimonadota bacterium]MDR7404906.1 cytochrome c oxidase subunit 3 [Armatimonadota bacterium]MDR7436905.1 cytochrome c oxidase subunit 3 [Armatimonadota bacterium]MDR7472321.1 cytochrome c oxidase subunit 3 [Armatimonadota bacterium]